MLVMLKEGRLCVFDLYPRVQTCHLPEEELPRGWSRCLSNVNTPEEFQSLEDAKP